MIYFDTSALIKGFVEEAGSAFVRKTIDNEEYVATSKIAYAEIYSGLNRKCRERHLTQADYRLVARRFEDEYSTYVRLEISDAILGLARDLLERHSLRPLDAIHISAALTLRSAIDESVLFASADRKLLESAQSEGLRFLDVEKAKVRKITLPKMTRVRSSSIESVGYDDDGRDLYVRFRESGKTYIYKDVDDSVFQDLMRSESKGVFVNRYVKNRYAYRELPEDIP